MLIMEDIFAAVKHDYFYGLNNVVLKATVVYVIVNSTDHDTDKW